MPLPEAENLRTPSPAPPLVTPSVSVTPPAPRRDDCVRSTELATARTGEPAGAICLVVGATLTVDAAPSPASPWQPLSTSDASVLRCKSTPGTDGTFSGGCQAVGAGVATIGSAAGPDTWRLTVTVVT